MTITIRSAFGASIEDTHGNGGDANGDDALPPSSRHGSERGPKPRTNTELSNSTFRARTRTNGFELNEFGKLTSRSVGPLCYCNYRHG